MYHPIRNIKEQKNILSESRGVRIRPDVSAGILAAFTVLNWRE